MPSHLEHPRPLPDAPLDDFTDLHRVGRPSDRAMIWFGAADEPVPFFMLTNPPRARTESGLRPAGYNVMFAMRNLTVYVVVPAELHRDSINHALGISHPHDFDPEHLVPVWPSAELITWPPPRKLETPVMERLMGGPADWSSEPSIQTGSWRPGRRAA